MAIYIFKLLVWCAPNGIDNAQGYRAKILREYTDTVRYIFTELPTSRDIVYYKKMGIDVKQMLSVHQCLTDNDILEPSVRIEDKLKELKDSIHYTDIISNERDIKLLKNGIVVASILRDETEMDFCKCIHYFSNGCYLIRTENFIGRMVYADDYATARSNFKVYAKHVRRTFFKSDGTVAYYQIYTKEEKECYLFPDGRTCTIVEFIAEFIKRLNLTENDVIILDRLTQIGFMQSLLRFKNKANLIVVFHSKHFLEKGEDPDRLYLNDEYYDWFKYSNWIDTMVVSTSEQKKELAEKLSEYRCSVPKIEVIPAGELDRLRYPKTKRQPYSLTAVSRLYSSKKVDWIIKSVIKAHCKNPNIFLDIYGRGAEEHTKYLKNLVIENGADSYIRFMGYADVTEIYKNYEVFITASLGETLGLTTLEAIGSGDAVIGLNVRYGNQVLIHSGENGYLINFCYTENEEIELVNDLADGIVKIFEDREKLEMFHQNSYNIAKNYLQKKIGIKWRKLLKYEEMKL